MWISMQALLSAICWTSSVSRGSDTCTKGAEDEKTRSLNKFSQVLPAAPLSLAAAFFPPLSISQRPQWPHILKVQSAISSTIFAAAMPNSLRKHPRLGHPLILRLLSTPQTMVKHLPQPLQPLLPRPCDPNTLKSAKIISLR